MIGAVPPLLTGNKEIYRKDVQETWTREQRMNAYKIISGRQGEVVAEKGFIMGASAALTIAPQFMPSILDKLIATKAMTVSAAQNIGKLLIGVAGVGAAVSTSTIVTNLASNAAGSFEAGKNVGMGVVGLTFSAYGMKKGWELAFPKKYIIQSYTVEYQNYYGETKDLIANYPKIHATQEYNYAPPTTEPAKNFMYDEAIYATFKGYKQTQLYTGDIVRQPFNINVKFRIAEHEGLYKPLMQNLEEVNLYFPEGYRPTEINLGITKGGKDIGYGIKDFYSSFSFEKTGTSMKLETGAMENNYRTLAGNAPALFSKGTGLKEWDTQFTNLVQVMRSDKDIVLMEAKYFYRNLEPELRKAWMSIPKGETAAIWKTTGDFYGVTAPKQDIFDMIGIRNMAKVGGISYIDIHEGSLVSVRTDLAQQLKVYQKPLYDITKYDKPIYVLANYPPETSLKLMPPTMVGTAADKFLFGMNLKSGAGMGLEAKTFTQPKIEMRYEPKMMIQPKYELAAMPKMEMRAMPELKAEPKMQPRMEVKPMMKLEMRSMMQLQTRMQMEMKPRLMLVFKERPEPVPNFFKEDKGLFSSGKSFIFGISKKDRHGREKWKLEPKTDWLSRIETEMMFGVRATNVPNKPKYRKAFMKEFMSPMGLFAGRMPSMEMIKAYKIKL